MPSGRCPRSLAHPRDSTGTPVLPGVLSHLALPLCNNSSSGKWACMFLNSEGKGSFLFKEEKNSVQATRSNITSSRSKLISKIEYSS